MENLIRFLLGNFTLTFLVIGLVCSIIALARRPKPHSGAVIVEALFSYYLLLPIGFAYLYNFVFHVFFHELSVKMIGWADSPFQLEVGFASLGIGILAFKGSFGLRLASVIVPSAFTLGAAGVHIQSMIAEHNFAPGNAGVIFYSDIFFPLIGAFLLWLQVRHAAGRTSPEVLSPLS
jgi:hypothetical protein